jgi:hypothetical protein
MGDGSILRIKYCIPQGLAEPALNGTPGPADHTKLNDCGRRAQDSEYKIMLRHFTPLIPHRRAQCPVIYLLYDHKRTVSGPVGFDSTRVLAGHPCQQLPKAKKAGSKGRCRRCGQLRQLLFFFASGNCPNSQLVTVYIYGLLIRGRYGLLIRGNDTKRVSKSSLVHFAHQKVPGGP